MTQRIWDISQRLSAVTPLWPGEPDVVLSRHAAIGPGCPVNIGALSFPLHAGTHADAPLHYSDDGVASADSPLDAYLGPCVVVDTRGAGARVECLLFGSHLGGAPRSTKWAPASSAIRASFGLCSGPMQETATALPVTIGWSAVRSRASA